MFLGQRVRDPHDHAAVNLALGREQIDDQTAVLNGDELVDADETCFGIDRDISHLHATDLLAGESVVLRTFARGLDPHHAEQTTRGFPRADLFTV